jgi:hypothetical protein
MSDVYYIADVLKALRPIHRKKFDYWLRNRTIMVVDDMGALYKWELEEFFDALHKEKRMLGIYRRCAQCAKFEHHKKKTDTVCEKCIPKKKLVKKETSPSDEKVSILF